MVQSKVLRSLTRLFVFYLPVSLWGPATLANAEGLEEGLARLPGIQASRLEEIEDWKSRPGELELPVPLLEEFALTRFSRWRLQGEGDWELKAWEARDSQGAFGMFAEQRARWRAADCGATLELPFDGVLCKSDLAFWRGTFFFRLKRLGRGAVGPGDYRLLAQSFQDAFTEPNLYPFSVVQLPLLDLHPETIRLYLGATGLGSDEAFPKGLIPRVGFDKQVEVVSARYGPGNRPFFLFGYPTASVAQQCAAKLNGSLPSYYFPEGVLLKRSALIVALYFGPEAEGRETMEQVHYDAKVKWIYDRGMSEVERRRRRGEVVSFFGIVTSSIFFTGFFLVLVMILGCFAGLVRYQVIKRFPIVAERNEMIRLDL